MTSMVRNNVVICLFATLALILAACEVYDDAGDRIDDVADHTPAIAPDDDDAAEEESTPTPEPTVTPAPTPTPEPGAFHSPEYLNPESAIRNAFREVFGTADHHSLSDYTENAALIQGTYHLLNADVGSWNAGTSDFYPWLVDFIRVRFDLRSQTGRVPYNHVLRENMASQVEVVFENPESELARALRALSMSAGDMEANSEPDIYWTFLIGPAMHMLVSPILYEQQWSEFHASALEFEDALLRGDVSQGDFPSVMVATGFAESFIDLLEWSRE